MKTNYYFSIFPIFFSFLVNHSNAQDSTNQKIIDSILIETAKLPTLYEKVKSLTGSAGKYRYRDFTKKFIDKSIEISTIENAPEAMSHSYYSLGNFYYYKSQLDTAKTLFNKALDLISNVNSPSLNSIILTSLSGIQKKEGNYSLAISSLFNAKEILEGIDTLELSKTEKYNRLGRKSVIDNSLAIIYTQLADFESAVYYYDLCYNTSLDLKNPVVAGIVLSNKGELLMKMGKYKEALHAQEIGKKLKLEGKAPKRSLALSDLNIGDILTKTNQFDNALKSFNNALHVFEKVNYPNGEMSTLTSRGNLFINIKKYDKAIVDCEKAKKLAFTLNDNEAQQKSCECLYNAYKTTGNIKMALENHELFIDKKELILNEQNIKKITQLEMQFDFDRKEEILEAENIAKEKEKNIIIKSLIGGIAALLIIALLFYRLFRIRKKAAIKLKKKNLQIKTALSEKEVLLKEIHHRVKNNLQIISSLLSMQSRQIDDDFTKQAIDDVKNRVKAMALIHQNLYQNENLSGVNAKDYIQKLTKNLVLNYKISNHDIALVNDIDELKLDIDTIIPFGLILNELITNSLKYAFTPDTENGKIYVSLKKQKNGLILEVSDNGSGLPKNFDIKKTTSLGFKLISAFCVKLKAKLIINRKTEGTSVRLEIPNDKIV